MKLQKYLTPATYILLVLACVGIVSFISRLADSPEPDRFMEAAEESETGECSPTTCIPEETKSGDTPDESETSTEQDETGLQTPADTGYRRRKDKMVFDETEEETAYTPPRLMLATDLHYYSAELTDGGEAFETWIAADDGKTSWYSEEMIDALLEEALRQKPTALVLTGDISSFGERENHLRLAEKLKALQAEGVQVLVIPGNHDINSHQAVYHYGDEAIPADTVSAEEFAELYSEFGYLQAYARDEDSLSYIYELDEGHWMMMLDTCQYTPVNQVNGRISANTLEWIDEQLSYAADRDIKVLAAGHHNLLYQSRLYTSECTIENQADLVEVFERYRLPVYISGHLHAQRVKQHKVEPGEPENPYRVTEIVLSPYCIPECRYGLMEWDDEDRLSFQTMTVSVSEWARRNGSEDVNLQNFDELAPMWSREVIKNQVKLTLRALPEEQIDGMAELYADIYYQYTKGNGMERSRVEHTEAWLLWERMDPENAYKREITRMLEDCKQSHLEWKEQEIIPEPGK